MNLMRCSTVLIVLLAIPGILYASWEGATFGVENFSSACDDWNNLSYTVDKADRFRDALWDIDYEQVKHNSNSGVQAKDFADVHAYSWGRDNNDPYGSDFADVVFYSGHGDSDCSYDRTWIIMGSTTNTCNLRLTSHVRYANGGNNEEAKGLFTDACETAQLCAWPDGFWSMDQGGSGTQFTVFAGWHGRIYDESGDPNMYYNYVTGAEYNGIGDDWVDLTDIVSGSNNDECAVFITFKYPTAIGIDQHGGFKDWKDVGTHTNSFYHFIGGCDPLSGPAL